MALCNGWGDQWPTEVAQVYAWVGDTDQAIVWLKKRTMKLATISRIQ